MNLQKYYPELNFFLENLDELIDAPNGIEKARELVLQIAVRGRLVKQDRDDESASELLKKIKAEKEKLISEGKIKKQRELQPIKEEEKPFVLPEGWEWVRNIELFEFERGNNPKDLNKIGGKYPYINIKAFETGIIEQYSDDENAKYCNDGDILIVCDGSRSGLLGEGIKGILGSTLARVDLHYSDISEYWKMFIRTNYNFFNSNKKGAAIPHLDINLFKNILFPLPPLAEQNRIVEKVNSLMSLLDQLEKEKESRDQKRIRLNNASIEKLLSSENEQQLRANWKLIEENFTTLYSVPENVDKLKQTILQLAVQGKLTSKWRNTIYECHPELVSGSKTSVQLDDGSIFEPASKLLKKIKAEKEKLISEGKIKKQPARRGGKELPPIKEEEKPSNLPNGWEWVRLQEIFDVRDGTHDTPKYIKEGIPLVTSRCFSNGEIDFSLAQNISINDHKEIQKRSNVEKQDILFSMIGGNLGNMVMVKTDKEFSIKNVALFKYYSKKLTSPYYLKLFLEHLANGIQLKAAGGAQPFVTLNFLRNHIFLLPPLAEQKRIVEKVNKLMSICNSLEENLTQKEKVAERFAGALVNRITK